ncbi:MAG TPA: Nramp family divalent metal transporter [Bacteroidales bacterium]|nr:Nramp family divalent metal transporter [Bacteroidales bacterium]
MKTNTASKSLEEVNESIDTAQRGSYFKKLLAFAGPAYLVSVGYMDPGNWATDIAGGSQFGYKLIWVLLMSNIMAVLLQSLSARLGIVRGRDLAQASRESYPHFINIILYGLAEIAIAACDLAEVLGMAIGLNLLFGLPLLWGVCLTLLDTFLLLFLINRGIRKMEAFILILVSTIGIAFLMEMIFAKPHIGDLAKGFIPSIPNSTALYIAIGIIGATVMPHNLYLHSSLVQTRKFGRSESKIREAIKFNLFDSVVALNLAFFVNAAILILAATTFYKAGLFNVTEINDAHQFLEPLLGTHWAPVLFAVALIAAGQSSTLTGTLAGQIVMEGYLNLRIQPWIRRILTRLIAIIPAVLTIVFLGEESTGQLLILSQVILSLQLGFAVIPLIHFVSDKQTMGKFAIGIITKIFAWLIAGGIVVLNARLVVEVILGWLRNSAHPWIIYLTVVPFTFMAGLILAYIIIRPFVSRILLRAIRSTHPAPPLGDITSPVKFSRIAVAIDFSSIDSKVIRHAMALAHSNSKVMIIHVVESVGAVILGKDTNDYETIQDTSLLENYQTHVQAKGIETSIYLGFGNPKRIIPEKVKEFGADLLLMGAHGHKGITDIIFGTTVDKVRHKVNIPVLLVKGE